MDGRPAQPRRIISMELESPQDAQPGAVSPRPKPQPRYLAFSTDLLLLALGLTVVLVTIKIRLLPFHIDSIVEFSRWLMRLGLVCASDLLFVSTLTIACALAGWSVRCWPRLYGVWRITQFAVFYVVTAYAIFAMALFRVTMQPFSIRMLTFVEGPAVMLDSIERYLTWQWIAALALVPPAVALGPWLWQRLPGLREDPPLGWRTGIAMGLALAAYVSASHVYIHKRWNEPRRWERRISCNPHLAFLGSCAEELMKDEPWTAIYHGNANEGDFLSRQRPEKHPAFNLASFSPSPRPKNVVVLLLESVGAEYLSLYGSKHNTTPHLDRLVAERGVVFDNFYVSVPYSCKSIVSLSAGVYPRVDWKLIMNDPEKFRVPTVTEVLKERGYRTCYAHSGYWSWRSRDRFLKNRVGTLIDAEHLPEQKISSWGVADRAMFEETMQWIKADPETPFFLLAYTIETHHPYATPKKRQDFGVEDEDLDGYLNAIRATDENIAWLIGQLEKEKLLDDTLIVITSDHGEAFGQHNQRSHNFGVYECNVHVPMIMLHPSLRALEGEAASGRVRAVREQIDFSPTVLDLLGFESPAVWQGRNLFRPDDGRPTYFYCVGNFVVLGLRDGKYKYHFYIDSGHEELFDLAADPGEQENLAAKHPDRCRDYRRRVGGLARYQRRFLAEQGSP